MEEQNQNQTESTVFKEKESKVGPIIGSIIVILIIIIGGIYFLSTRVEQIKEQNQNPEQSADELESEIDSFNTAEFEAEIDAMIGEFDSE